MRLPHAAAAALLVLAAAAAPAAAAGPAAVPTTGASPSGTTYWVAPGGHDGADGRSPATPFRRIQQCADAMVPGDTCLIGTGDYAETVRPARSGTADRPITYRAAPGARPVLTGTSGLHGFTPVHDSDVAEIAKRDPYAADSDFSRAVAAGHVYSAPADLGADVTTVQVFTDRRMDVEAQFPYPGLDLLDPVLEYAGAGSDGAVIADPGQTRPAGYWNGARALTGYWYVSATGTVKSSAPGSVELDTAPPCTHKIVPKDTRYALAGKIGELAHPGEWFYDPAAKRLYLYSEDNPNRHAVEARTRPLGLDLTAASHTDVTGLGLFATTIRTGPGSTGVHLDRITGRYLSHYTDITRGATDCGSSVTRGTADTGIVLDGTGNSITGSDLAYSAGNAVALRGSGNTASGNTIHDVDYLGTYAAGVAVQGNGQTVTRNTIGRVGRSGINLQWDTADGAPPAPDRIAHNDISRYARLSLDTAAIYTCCGADMMGTSIDHNVLHDATPTPKVTPFAVTGVYADNGQSNLLIADNVGWGNINGTVMLNGLGTGSHDNRVYNNTGGMTLFYVKEPGHSTGTVVANNIGTIAGLTGATDGGMVITNNLPAGTDPLFADPAAHDYRLTAASPARNQAIPVDGVTDGSTDPVPSLGAYQYGAPQWTAGAPR